MNPENTIKHLIRSICRALLATPDLEPKINIRCLSGMGYEIEVDTFPFDFGPIVGKEGSMKFAIQSVIAAAGHPTGIKLLFADTGKTRPPRLRGQRPSAEALTAVTNAAVNHWNALGFEAVGRVELSQTCAISIIDCDPRLANAQVGPFPRICRAIGKANGFKATTYIEKAVGK